MKAKELAELLLDYPDQDVTVSVDISKGEDDAGNRAFGEIVEFVNSARELVLICSGTVNCELVPYDKRVLTDLTKMWSEACEIARQYCPVDVGRSHIKEGIPRLAKRAADAEAERDKLRAQIDAYKDDQRSLEPLRWAFVDNQPLDLNKELSKEWRKKIDTQIVEELTIASIVAKNEELKKRVEALEMAVECLNGGKR